MKNKKLYKGVVITGIILIAAGIAGLFFQNEIKAAIMGKTVGVSSEDKPRFVFDSAKVSGWWTAGNRWPDPAGVDTSMGPDIQLPVADISVHQCKVASKCEDFQKDGGGHCFVAASYMTGTIDPEKKMAETVAQNEEWGMEITDVGTKNLVMATSDGDKEYALYQYDYNNKGSDKIMRGNGQGYVLLKDGYIDVRSVCSESSQLEEAISALGAIRFVNV